MWLGRTALAVLVVGVLVVTARTGDLRPATGGGKKRIEARVTATAEKPAADGAQKVTVVLDVNPGWYAYPNPVGNEMLENNRTEIKVSAGAKLEKVTVTYPPGKAKQDKFIGSFTIYEGKVAIPVLVQRARGDTSPLEVSVRYCVCSHKGECLPVDQIKITLP
jgi:DsbC/DsbD-like thiol-disulfide interchange protein